MVIYIMLYRLKKYSSSSSEDCGRIIAEYFLNNRKEFFSQFLTQYFVSVVYVPFGFKTISDIRKRLHFGTVTTVELLLQSAHFDRSKTSLKKKKKLVDNFSIISVQFHDGELRNIASPLLL